MSDGFFDYSRVESSVDPTDVLSWESQARQYPATNRPGVQYFRGDVGAGRWVDCLLHYDPDGTLSGILNYFPQDLPPWEKKGAVNIWVRPDRLRQGIGTALVDEAVERWPLYGEDQQLTDAGAAFAKGLHGVRKGVTPKGTRYDRRKPSGPATSDLKQ